MIESENKPTVSLVGEDGNIFNLMAICSRALKKDGFIEEAKEMTNKIFNASSYNEALNILGEYVNIQ